MWLSKIVLGALLSVGLLVVPSFAQSMSSDNVKKMQESLKEKGYYKGKVDGIVGPQTRSAIRRYQQSEKLTVSGRYTKETAERMGLASDSPGEHFEDAGAAIANQYSKAGSEVAQGSKEMVQEGKKGEITEAGKEFGKGIGSGAKAVGKGTVKAAKSVGKGVKDAFDGSEEKK